MNNSWLELLPFDFFFTHFYKQNFQSTEANDILVHIQVGDMQDKCISIFIIFEVLTPAPHPPENFCPMHNLKSVFSKLQKTG